MYPGITFLADIVYRFLQHIDRTHRVARFAKSNTKIFLRCIEKIRDESIAYATRKNVDIICCGHTHVAELVHEHSVSYCNSGCWTESPCSYLTVKNDIVQLNAFESVKQKATEEIVEVSASEKMFSSRELVLN